MKHITKDFFREKISHLNIFHELLYLEKAWICSDNEKKIAVILEDLFDRDYGYALFSLDCNGNFEFYEAVVSFQSYHQALHAAARKLSPNNKKRDLFETIVDKEKLCRSFLHVKNKQESAPARKLMNEIYHTYYDKDGNFVEQFQTTGFDARVFELYLYAYFSESGYEIDNRYSSPDFNIIHHGERVSIEAVTANPSDQERKITTSDSKRISKDDFGNEDFIDEVIVKLSEVLLKKSNKKYWESQHCKNIPFVIAIQDFHKKLSLLDSSSPLSTYLYGTTVKVTQHLQNRRIYSINKVDTHKYKSREIISNFFENCDAAYVSAVMFTNAGTYAKFNRMALQAGYYRDNVSIKRIGLCLDNDPDATMPAMFEYDVGDPAWLETWGQSLTIFHNPHAKFPLAIGYFKDAFEYYFVKNELQVIGPQFYPIVSTSHVRLIKPINA